jgi:hypothetical protein
MKGFNKCPNGHYYQGATCPYCPSNGTSKTDTKDGVNFDEKTQIYANHGEAPTQTAEGNKTKIMNSQGGYGETTIDGNGLTLPMHGRPRVSNDSNKTIFGDEVEVDTPSGGIKVEQRVRTTRKLVGWLVTYTLDAMGVDFKLYEGRNVIGRDVDCNITVDDGMMSGKHATLLFRVDKYSLTDSQSSHGTFVNDEDIDLEPCYLKDGDVIRMGKTVFKFRISL